MMASGNFELKFVEAFPVVDVIGEVDLTNAPAFDAVLGRAASANRGTVIVSLTQATYFDSKGIHVLLRFAERLSTNRQRLLVVAPQGQSPQHILKIAGVDKTVRIFDSLDEAVASGP